MPTLEEPVKCRGVNGSICLREDRLSIAGNSLGVARSRELLFNDVAAVVVERKSVIPFATVMVLVIVVTVLLEYNAVWFVIDLSRDETSIASVGLVIVTLCAIVVVLRTVFVNVSIRSSHEEGTITVRLVPSRCARRLARQFRERSGSR